MSNKKDHSVTSFKDDWLCNDKYRLWLRKTENTKSAYCFFCKTSKNIENQESIEDISITDMSWDDVQRLVAAFVFCIIGTLASNGNMVWTLLMFAYLVAMWFWWASDKQDELHNMWAKKYKITIQIYVKEVNFTTNSILDSNTSLENIESINYIVTSSNKLLK